MTLLVSSSNPIADSTDHPVNETISVVFNIGLNPDTISPSSIILYKPPYTIVPSTLVYNSSQKTVYIKPEAFLLPSTSYTIMLVADSGGNGSGLQGYDGSTLAGNYYIRFSTAPTVVSPSGTYVTDGEYFIDTLGANGAGTNVSPSDGSFNSEWEQFYATISTSGLTVGTHTIYVHGKDNSNVWGTIQSIPFEVTNVGETSTAIQGTYTANVIGPATMNLVVSPSPTSGAPSILLTGLITTRTYNEQPISGELPSSTATDYLTVIETVPEHMDSLVTDDTIQIVFSHNLSESYNDI